MCAGRTAEGLSVVSDSEVLVVFVILDGEGAARGVAERHKIIKRWRGWDKKV
jgi:hypothetical protein